MQKTGEAWHRERHAFFDRENWLCKFCNHQVTCETCEPQSPLNQSATIDHIEPKYSGGSRYNKSNWQLLCQLCNNTKSNFPIANAAELRELVYAVQVEGHPSRMMKLDWPTAIKYADLKTQRKPSKAKVFKCSYSWCDQWHINLTQMVKSENMV